MGEKNFTARTKASFRFYVEVKDSFGAPVPLTGYSVDMQIARADGTTEYDLGTAGAITISDAANGQIYVNVPPAETTTWPIEVLYYDIHLINGAVKDPLLWGAIFVEQGVTS